MFNQHFWKKYKILIQLSHWPTKWNHPIWRERPKVDQDRSLSFENTVRFGYLGPPCFWSFWSRSFSVKDRPFLMFLARPLFHFEIIRFFRSFCLSLLDRPLRFVNQSFSLIVQFQCFWHVHFFILVLSIFHPDQLFWSMTVHFDLHYLSEFRIL